MFSVIIPLFNKRPYVGRCVQSVLHQSFTDFELIIVDDGSTDGGIDVLADIGDKRLRIIQQKNTGVGAARNAGMGAACGDWFAFLDADDAWSPQHLAELAMLAATFPGAGLLSTTHLEATGTEVPELRVSDTIPSVRVVDYFLEASRRIGFVNSTSAAVKRSVFEALGGFTVATAGEDLEYWARVALYHPVAVSDRVTCFYFRDTGGTMHALGQTFAQPQPPMSSLRELSLSVAMLCDRAAENPLLWENPSIRRYVNGRLEATVLAALYRGQTADARNYGTFMMPPLTWKQRFFRLAGSFPKSILRAVVFGYRRLRALRHPVQARL